MSIQRFEIWGDDGYMIDSGDGDYIKHSDHLAAMKELEERMMRFSDWIWRKERNRDRYGFPIAENIQEAFQYFLDNVEPSESQLKEESNPNRKYL